MNKSVFVIIGGVTVSLVLILYFDTPWFPSLSVFLLFYFLFSFIYNSGNTVSFRELTMVIAVLQLLFTSLIAFYNSTPNPIFAPEGDPIAYFNYAIPGVMAYGIGLFALNIKYDLHTILKQAKKYNLFAIGIRIITIGLVSVPIKLFVPASISYFITLVSFFSIIGGIIIMFSDKKRIQKLLILFISFLPILSSALVDGIFFLVLVWGAFIVIYYFISVQYSLFKRFIIISLSLFGIVLLDSVKSEYRAILGDSPEFSESQKAFILGGLIIDNVTLGQFSNKGNMSARVTRANQGALVTWVMNYVPESEPYAHGSTIKSAIVASLFPRFLYADKAIAGGVENFEKFTGRNLINTSMNISLLGEGWANFGYWGGILFMFCVGLFYCFILKIVIYHSKYDPLIIFWIPFLFLFSIKAEDDLLTPLNHIMKASMVYLLFYNLYLKSFYKKHLLSND